MKKGLAVIFLFFSVGVFSQNKKPVFLFGSNFIPSTASNQMEMWQAETFDTATIAKELKLASSIGMNTMRVFLHDLVYAEDPKGFMQRVNTFLSIANRYHIRTLLVFFDSCWDPYPHTGKQDDPVPHVHNSRWVQSPGAAALQDTTQYKRLESYVKAVVKYFANDKRIFGWDVWNEPDNTNDNSYGKVELKNKNTYVLPLLKRAFAWIRSQHPSQPLTSGVWRLYENWTPNYQWDEMEKVQIESSDVLSFHFYGDSADLVKRVVWLRQFHKPLVCTEYLARGNKSTFETILPVFVKYNVGAINWGFVDGRTQTKYPWDSWDKKYTAEPALWHHEIFRKDGTPYKETEVNFIKTLVGRTNGGK